MTPGDLIPIIREAYLQDITDALNPERSQMFSDPWLLREVATAQRQACLRQDLRHIYDDETAELCSIALVSGQATYTLDSRILRLDEVRIGDDLLVHTTKAALDEARPSWRQMVPGTPKWFVVTGRTLRLVPAPTAAVAADPLSLSVWRLPLVDPNMGDDLEWPGEAEQFGHWVAFRAFSVPNSGFDEPERAARERALFDAAFGREVPAQARAELLAYPSKTDMTPAWRRTARAGLVCELETW
jgi:hypothetical protein